MNVDMERRREQNRLAQRRYRQRQQQMVEQAVQVLYLSPSASPNSTYRPPSASIPSTSIPAGLENDMTPVPELSNPPAPAPTAVAPGSTKSFCDLIADGANLLLNNLGDIDMDNIQLPESFLSGQNYLIMPPTPSGDPTLVNTTPGSMASSYIELQHASRDSSLPSDASDVQGDRESERQSASGWLSPLHMAAKKGHEKIVRALLQHDANCNLKDSDGLTPLLHALMGGFRDIVSLLLSHGARIDEVDPQKRTALHWTVIRKQEALLKMLLEHGGAKPSIIDSYDESGRTPLHIAVEEDFEAGVQLLLQFGANVHTQARKSAL